MNVVKINEKEINNFISNPKARKYIYGIYAVLGVIIGAIQTGFEATEYSATWLTVCVAVYSFLALPVGALALTNTPTEVNNVKRTPTHRADV